MGNEPLRGDTLGRDRGAESDPALGVRITITIGPMARLDI
jgi:hypothetical protein